MLIYFVQSVEGGLIKIGRSSSPAQRLMQLQAHSPLPLEILGVAHGSPLSENLLHRKFAAQRQHGEWFEPCEELLKLIAKLPKDENAPNIPTFDHGPPPVVQMYEAGYTMGQIGDVLSVSRQRVHQILKEEGYENVERKPIEKRPPPRDYYAAIVGNLNALELR